MTLADLRIPCEHGRYEGHGFSVGYRPTTPPTPPGIDSCPGGRPATIEDLDGRTYGFCETHGSLQKNPHEKGHCEFAIGARSNRYLAACRLVQMVFIPSGVIAEEESG